MSSREEGPGLFRSRQYLQEQYLAHRGHSISIYCCYTASASTAQPHQNGCFWTHIPLLCWPQANLSNGHHLSCHHHHLSDCTGHLHHHPAWHSGQNGEKQTQTWRPHPKRELGLKVRGPDSDYNRSQKEAPVLRKHPPPTESSPTR